MKVKKADVYLYCWRIQYTLRGEVSKGRKCPVIYLYGYTRWHEMACASIQNHRNPTFVAWFLLLRHAVSALRVHNKTDSWSRLAVYQV